MNRHGLNLQNRPSLTVSMRPEQMQELATAAEQAATYWRLRCADGESSALRLFLACLFLLRLQPPPSPIFGASGD